MFNFSFLHFLFRSRYLLHIQKGKLLEMAEIKLEYAFIHIILIIFFLSETLGGGGICPSPGAYGPDIIKCFCYNVLQNVLYLTLSGFCETQT